MLATIHHDSTQYVIITADRRTFTRPTLARALSWCRVLKLKATIIL